MHDLFLELSLIIAIATGIAFVMRLIRQPLIIGHIITGIIVGPVALRLVSSPDTLAAFSSIGIALLLFIVGLGLNPQVIKEVGKVVGVVGAAQLLGTAGFGWLTGHIFGLGRTEALIYGAGLSFSSTIIVLKLLNDKKEQLRLYGKITIGITLVQDITATIALLLVASKASDQNIALAPFLGLAAKGLFIGVPMYLVSNYILPRLHKLIAGSQEFLFLFAIGWGFGSAALFEQVGFSLEVGALFAGVCLAPLVYAQEISARLRPLRDFFVIVFFITLGSGLQFSSINHLVPLILAGLFITIVIKPLIIVTILGLMGYTKRTGFKTAISLAQVSEFSLVLVVLAQRKGLIGADMLTILTVIAISSIAISAYMIIYADKLYLMFEKYLSVFEWHRTRPEHEHQQGYELVLFGYQKGGHEFLKMFEQLKKRFVVIDYDPEVIDHLERHKIQYLYGDATDIELLQEAGLDKAKLIVSVVTEFETTEAIVSYAAKNNRRAVIICHADNAEHAGKLYELGASYVMMPHYIGSEKISAFIKRTGLKKSEFKKFREKHLQYLEEHHKLMENPQEHSHKLGQVIMHHTVGETSEA
jgi:Kef-type K+ transport system membrane component KefB/Trk K+ transport system NAD-binding subunit